MKPFIHRKGRGGRKGKLAVTGAKPYKLAEREGQGQLRRGFFARAGARSEVAIIRLYENYQIDLAGPCGLCRTCVARRKFIGAEPGPLQRYIAGDRLAASNDGPFWPQYAS